MLYLEYKSSNYFMFDQSQFVMCLIFFHFKYWLFLRKIKQIHGKVWLVEYKVRHKKWHKEFLFKNSYSVVTTTFTRSKVLGIPKSLSMISQGCSFFYFLFLGPLASVLKAFISRLLYDSFNTILIGNIKSYQKITCFFSHKNFLKIFYKSMSLRHPLTFFLFFFFLSFVCFFSLSLGNLLSTKDFGIRISKILR